MKEIIIIGCQGNLSSKPLQMIRMGSKKELDLLVQIHIFKYSDNFLSNDSIISFLMSRLFRRTSMSYKFSHHIISSSTKNV